MPGLRRSRAARYAAAVVAIGLALLLQMLLVPLFGGDPNLSPFMVFFAAVMVAAWFGGLGPGLFSVGLDTPTNSSASSNAYTGWRSSRVQE